MLTVVSRSSDKISYFSNVNGDGTSWLEVIINDASRSIDPTYLTIGNFDEDDDLELLARSYVSSRLPIDMFEIDRRNAYSTVGDSLQLYCFSAMYSADMNNDGTMDVVFADNQKSLIVLWNGTFNFGAE